MTEPMVPTWLSPRPPRWRWPMLIPWSSRTWRCYRCRWAIDLAQPPGPRNGWRRSRRVEITGLPGNRPNTTWNLAALCTGCWERCTVDERVQAHLWQLRDIGPLDLTHAAIRTSVVMSSILLVSALQVGEQDGIDSLPRPRGTEEDLAAVPRYVQYSTWDKAQLVDLLVTALCEWIIVSSDEDIRRGRYHSTYARSLNAADFRALLQVVAHTARDEGRPPLEALDHLLKALDGFMYGPIDALVLRAKIVSQVTERIGPELSQQWGRGVGRVVDDLD